MTDSQLLAWIITHLLTDSQLDVIPPGEFIPLRELKINADTWSSK